MITGNKKWTEDLGREQKKALYALSLPAYGVIVLSCLPSDLCPGDGGGLYGWGVFLWGIGPWGN